MKIVLVEERNGQQGPERTFEQQTIKIGRDPAECLIVFDQADWPMVSRRHAEIRFKDSRHLLVDTNSSFGTFLNGQRITEPVEIKTGGALQFGAGGPVMRVTRIEQTSPAVDPEVSMADQETHRDLPQAPPRVNKPAQAAPPTPPRATPPPPPSPKPATPSAPPTVELMRKATGKMERVTISDKEVVALGRDPASDVVIDADAAVVSRRHAEIRRRDGQCVLFDLGSFNGTLINDQRIASPTPLYDGDRIQLGMGGPIMRFNDPSHLAPAAGQMPAGQRAVSGAVPIATPAPGRARMGEGAMGTMVIKAGSGSLNQQMPRPMEGGQQPQLLMQLAFDGRPQLSIGRAPDNDIRLDGLQISNHHAQIKKDGGTVFIEDAGSTNGVYINGARITGRRPIQNQDIVQIGPFVLQADPQRGVAIFDTRSKTRIDVIDITKVVKNRSGGGMLKLLDDVDLTIQPNEFVGLLGPSGAGKSTLMDAMNGMRPASSGSVLINNLDLYQHLDSIKQSIGYVPQEDIIHRELTVYRTLYYVARLRLSRDVSTAEIDQIVSEVMDVTGLAERRDVPVGQLSGGQRKRVSIAVELITKPSVIFLDEPTSGLDPATEEKIMRLFRQIAESGRTVILTTHAMENVRLFDKIVVMMRGKLVFYGAPQEALAHIKADSFKDLYDKLEAPIDERVAKMGLIAANATQAQKQEFKKRKEQISEEVADEWKVSFQRTEQYQRNIVQPLSGLKRDAHTAAPARRRVTVTDALRQWATLARRYMEVLGRDKFNLLILFGQAPIVAVMTYLVVDHDQPRDFPYFVLALVAVWFGTSVAAREVIRERAVYNRERMVNLGLLPYIGSKLLVLSLIVGIQCIFLFGTLKIFDLVGLMSMPGYLLGLPQVIIMIMTGMVGIALGLFVSSVVKTSEMATSVVPLILIPQILFSGLVGVPQGFSVKAVGAFMPATWSFDEMKQLSGLDTLKEEGSDPKGPNEGRGLYKQIEKENDAIIDKAKKDIDKYRDDADSESKDYQDKMEAYIKNVQTNPSLTKPKAPELAPAPSIGEARKIPEDLSKYIAFLHPLGHIAINPFVLIIMFFGLLISTIIALRAQDIG